MTGSLLVRIFEHNNWANLELVRACAELSDEQLDAEPQIAAPGSIRRTLEHLVGSQDGYLAQITRNEDPDDWDSPPTFIDLEKTASTSGEGLIALARDPSSDLLTTAYRKDEYRIDPWVVMVQALHHGAEHREQICSMISALGLEPPRLAGWSYGRVTGGLSVTDVSGEGSGG